jgi:predicted porin
MKKTIVAAAIAAVVSAPAFADVSISGQINQEFLDGVAADGLSTDNNTDLVFKASEDLGNGMKATATLHWMGDDAAATAGTQFADQKIELTGDFGTIAVGRMEDFTEGKASALMNIDASDALDLEDNRFDVGRSEGGMAYVSPSMNGFQVGVAGYTVEANTDNVDATDLMVSYTNGPFHVIATRETFKDDTNPDATTTMLGATYTLGDLRLVAVTREVENGYNDDNTATAAANDADSTMIGAQYTMGANQFAIGQIDMTGADHAAGTAGEDTSDATIISFKHSLSKNTNVYIVNKNEKETNLNDLTAIGVQVKF